MRHPSRWKLILILVLILNLFPFNPSGAAIKSKSAKSVSYLQSKSSDYLDFQSCKLQDAEDIDSPANVYKRDIYNLDPGKPIRVLIFPVDFSDLPGITGYEPSFLKLEESISDYYQAVSQGKMKFKWVQAKAYARLGKSVSEYGAGGRANYVRGAEIIRDAQDLAFKSYDREDFDFFIVAPPKQTKSEQISTSISFLKVDNNYLNGTILAADYWQSNQNWTLPAHEIGHALGLVDLYSLNAAGDVSDGISTYHSQFKYMGFFDLMNWPNGPAPELTAWNRWNLGFLTKDEIRCLPTNSTITLLSPLEEMNKRVKALFIKLDASKLLVIENRNDLGFDQGLPNWAIGVIVYLVDLTKESGAGQLMLIKKESAESKEIFGQALQKGERVKVAGYSIENLEFGKDGALVRVKSLVN